MPAKSRITLGDIAGLTGVTRMAVSLALRDKAGVSDETRKKVLKVAGKLGYRPDPEIANLMARIRLKTVPKTKSCLALLTAGPVSEGSKRSLTERKYVQGIINRAKEYGYRIEDFAIDGGTNATRIGNILRSRGIEGVILRPLQYRPDVIVSVSRFGIRLIEERGLAVPGELGYASLDLDGDMPEYEGLSGIDQNSHMVGAAAVDMLVGAIQRGQRGVPLHPVRIEVEGVWRHGTSTVRQDGARS